MATQNMTVKRTAKPAAHLGRSAAQTTNTAKEMSVGEVCEGSVKSVHRRSNGFSC